MEGRRFTRVTSTVASYVPGASPRTPKRNVIVLIVYLLVLLLVASGVRAVVDVAAAAVVLAPDWRRDTSHHSREVGS